MSHYHAAIWLDHTHALVFDIGPDDFTERTVKSHGEAHLHHKAGSTGSGHAKADQHYYHAVAEAVAGAHEVYVCGPGSAKTEFVKHVTSHDPQIARKIVKTETADHPTGRQIVAAARKFFTAYDRTTPQR